MRICFLFTAILIFGCKKYPEGGRLGGSTGTDQRIEGDYNIVSYTVNGHDSLAALTSNPGYCATLKIKFERNQGGNNIVKPSCGTYPSNSWATDDRKQVELSCSFTTGASSLSAILSNQNLMLPWDIQKLTKEEFWITTSYDNNSYYLKLKR